MEELLNQVVEAVKAVQAAEADADRHRAVRDAALAALHKSGMTFTQIRDAATAACAAAGIPTSKDLGLSRDSIRRAVEAASL